MSSRAARWLAGALLVASAQAGLAQPRVMVVVDASESMCGYYRPEVAPGPPTAFQQFYGMVQNALVTSDARVDILNLATTGTADKTPLKPGEKSLRDYFRNAKCPFRGVTSELHKVLAHEGFESSDLTLILTDAILTEPDRIGLARSFQEWANRRKNRWPDVSVGVIGIKSEFTGRYFRELPVGADQTSFDLERHARPVYMIWYSRNGEMANRFVQAVWKRVSETASAAKILHVIAPLPGDEAMLGQAPQRLSIVRDSVALNRLASGAHKGGAAYGCLRESSVENESTRLQVKLGKGALCTDLNSRFALGFSMSSPMNGGGLAEIRVNGSTVPVTQLDPGKTPPVPKSVSDLPEPKIYRSGGRYEFRLPVETRREQYSIEVRFPILPRDATRPDGISVNLAEWSSSADLCRRFVRSIALKKQVCACEDNTVADGDPVPCTKGPMTRTIGLNEFLVTIAHAIRPYSARFTDGDYRVVVAEHTGTK